MQNIYVQSRDKQDVFQSKADQSRMCVFSYARLSLSFFCSCDLDLDPMTLIDELDLDIRKLYLQTENEASRSMLSKARSRQTHAHTDATERITTGAFAGGNELLTIDNAVVTREIKLF